MAPKKRKRLVVHTLKGDRLVGGNGNVWSFSRIVAAGSSKVMKSTHAEDAEEGDALAGDDCAEDRTPGDVLFVDEHQERDDEDR